MEVRCTRCSNKIDTENINVETDTGYCPSCENLFSLSSLLKTSPNINFDIRKPVKGVRIEDSGYDWSIEVSHRSGIAVFLVPFTLIWAGGSLSGIYGSQITSGTFDLAQSLFGLPFLLGSIFLITVTFMSIFGRTYISCHRGKSLLFIGVGSIGWYRRFDWRGIRGVQESDSRKKKSISLEGEEQYRFGWGLSSKKRYFLTNFLKAKLGR